MPTFYEGAPVSEFCFTLKKDEYIKARYAEEENRSVFSKKEFKVSLLASLCLIFGISIPYFLRQTGNAVFPIVLILIMLFLIWFFLYAEPERLKENYSESFDTNKFLSLENTVHIYRDSIIFENKYEKYLQYYTDFEKCTETDEYIILTGGKREFLIIKKAEAQNKEKISTVLFNAFAFKYRRINVK